MKFFVDFACGSLNKSGEELCGDKVEFFRTSNCVIAVLSDGLGSGVKANILATLSSKIAMTMLKAGLSIDEVVDTMVHTLPVCQVRKLAYSTLTIVKIDEHDHVYVVEIDNPGVFFIRDGSVKSLISKERFINGRKIKESQFLLQEGDTLVLTSDGVIHAGVGTILNLGWGWPEISHLLQSVIDHEKSAHEITNLLLEVCSDLYEAKPGDDTTVATLKVIKPKWATLFAGPPQSKEEDKRVVETLMRSSGKKVICGGTAANIVAREIHEEIQTSFDYMDFHFPPIASLRGIDLVTEGVLTMKGAVDILREIQLNSRFERLKERHGAARLAQILYEECTHIHLLVGRAINDAHQNPDFPKALSIKLRVIEELEEILIKIGKVVEIQYF